jgi:hypothetical protein
MNRAVMLVMVVVVGVWMTAAGLKTPWLTEAFRVFGLLGLPAAIAATLLVRYFTWRARVLRRIRADAPPLTSAV